MDSMANTTCMKIVAHEVANHTLIKRRNRCLQVNSGILYQIASHQPIRRRWTQIGEIVKEELYSDKQNEIREILVGIFGYETN